MSDQLTSVEGMSPEEIRKATREGRLDALLSGDLNAIAEAKADALIAEREAAEKPGNIDQGARGGAVEKFDAAWLATASPEAIRQATAAGKLADLL